MKNVINIILTALLFASVTFKANAQALDMGLLSPIVNPSPAVFPGTATISFTVVAEILDEPLSSDDLGISHARITIGLSNLQGSALILPTGPGADLFNWVYNAIDNTYIGSSKDGILPADTPLGITLTALPITAATTANITGFGANLTPPGDLLASESNDDAVSNYTSAPLPVTLVSFTAQSEGQTAKLNWATTSETNSNRFEIEQSLNGKEWNRIGTVESTGESKVLIKYSFTDVNPVAGSENLYRLKMIDNDETFAYSRIQSVKFDGFPANLTVYPNPVTDKLLVGNYSKVKEVTLNNASGTALFQGGKMSSDGIDVSKLLPGIYIVTLTLFDGTISTHKVAVTR